jgi:hypothetical protein
MKIAHISGVICYILLLASALAHALLGWPPLRDTLVNINADSNLVGALAAGWYFGSLSMLTFGIIVLQASYKVLSGKKVSLFSPRVIALAFIVFGMTAYCVRDFNPHFLGFAGLGLLLGFFSFAKTGVNDGTE